MKITTCFTSSMLPAAAQAATLSEMTTLIVDSLRRVDVFPKDSLIDPLQRRRNRALRLFLGIANANTNGARNEVEVEVGVKLATAASPSRWSPWRGFSNHQARTLLAGSTPASRGRGCHRVGGRGPPSPGPSPSPGASASARTKRLRQRRVRMRRPGPWERPGAGGRALGKEVHAPALAP